MSQPGETIRVLVVEESPSIRELLAELVGGDPRLQLVATGSDGQEAVDLNARLRPDVIVMNMALPRLDGIGATRRIMADTPTPIVLFRTDSASDDSAALQAGAVSVVEMRLGAADPGYAPALQQLLTAIRLMAEVKVVRRPASGVRRGPISVPPYDPTAPVAITRRRPVILVVAASTGGPQAIQTVLQALGADLDVPVLVVQHMSRGFLSGMVGWLAATCPQAVRLAAHGEQVVGGTVYVAPEDYHLLISGTGKLALTKAPPLGGFRPSANTLFESAAHWYGAEALGLVLTGMGDDGATGLAALRAAGASTIAQDEASAVVYGMPRAAAAVGGAERVLPLAAIGAVVRRLLGLKSLPYSADAQAEA